MAGKLLQWDGFDSLFSEAPVFWHVKGSPMPGLLTYIYYLQMITARYSTYLLTWLNRRMMRANKTLKLTPSRPKLCPFQQNRSTSVTNESSGGGTGLVIHPSLSLHWPLGAKELNHHQRRGGIEETTNHPIQSLHQIIDYMIRKAVFIIGEENARLHERGSELLKTRCDNYKISDILYEILRDIISDSMSQYMYCIYGAVGD
ncbi:predicted protein [Histoplasma capsulatum var. duboisii H88]|uniref:Predicted protein n=1 Tax=Ajellomyces capsulatus (strain H88) TaxID=544711 RepID=F0USG3_AJEC8|nr:predicted protein [Histoplasma capsulatum var. duboisii H88]